MDMLLEGGDLEGEVGQWTRGRLQKSWSFWL